MSHSVLRAVAAGVLMPGFVGTTVPAWLRTELSAGLRAVCLYGANLEDPDQARALCADLHDTAPGLLIATDEEGGDVTRLHMATGAPTPGNAVLGRLDDPALTRTTARQIGAELADVGIGLDLAPVVDINSTRENPVIGTRSFGGDPGVVSRHTVAYIEGILAAGVAACAKHFPGHGDTHVDSHVGQAVVTASRETLEVRELAPFRAAVAAGVPAVMTSHVLAASLDPQNPATFSAPILRGLLRDDLGFTGVIISDALDMAGAAEHADLPTAAVRALSAGADLLCLGSDTTHEQVVQVIDAICRAVRAGTLDVADLKRSAARVARLAAKHAQPASPAAPNAEPSAGASAGASAQESLRSEELRRRIIATFEVGPAINTWLAAPGPVCLVQVESEANQAVGPVSWGPACVGSATARAASLATPGSPWSAGGSAPPTRHGRWPRHTEPPAARSCSWTAAGRGSTSTWRPTPDHARSLRRSWTS